MRHTSKTSKTPEGRSATLRVQGLVFFFSSVSGEVPLGGLVSFFPFLDFLEFFFFLIFSIFFFFFAFFCFFLNRIDFFPFFSTC